MQCTSCFSNNLTLADGRYVCDECGEELAGVQQEDMDGDLFAGTAINNRASQSSQAARIRRDLQAMRSSAAEQVEPLGGSPEHMQLLEAMFLLTNALANRLIELDYLPPRTRKPLFRIVSAWARRCHIRAHQTREVDGRMRFQPLHSLALIALVAVHVRAPLLPRDICRLVYTRQLPYVCSASTAYPDSFNPSPPVRAILTPTKLPSAVQIMRTANFIARDPLAWPGLREYFKSNAGPRALHYVNPYNFNLPAFPLGSVHVTLLRLCRLLGLPDSFGARVMRFSELRRTAVKMARMFGGHTGGPWDSSRVDAYDPALLQTLVPERHGNFADVPPQTGDLYGFPTDESVVVDLINTMRLCYGRHGGIGLPPHGWVGESSREREDPELLKEWAACRETMLQWLRRGTPEDVDAVGWTGLSPVAIDALRGRRLDEYVAFVDDMMATRGERMPEMWAPHLDALRQARRRPDDAGALSASEDEDEGQGEGEGDAGIAGNSDGSQGLQEASPKRARRREPWDDGEMRHVRTERTCMYDMGRCVDTAEFEPEEGVSEMNRQLGYDPDECCLYGKREPVIGMSVRSDDFSMDGDLRDGNGLYALGEPEMYDWDRHADGRPRRGHPGMREGARIAPRSRVAPVDRRVRSGSERFAVEGVRWRKFEQHHRAEFVTLAEPTGVALAWTIVVRFFEGSSLELAGMEKDSEVQDMTKGSMLHMRVCCDHSMRVVLRYLRALRRSGRSC